jgi:hypothetical protein
LKTGIPTSFHRLWFGFKGYDRFMKTYQHISQFDKNEVARFRLEAIKFFNEFGLKPTLSFYKVSKATFYRWKKKLKDNQGRLNSLVPLSTRPNNLRVMNTDKRIIEFIKSLRERYPGIGKDKIKPLLDKHCLTLGIDLISSSTIGKVIKRHHFFYQKTGRIYHKPSLARELSLRKKRKKRLRVRYAPKPESFGHLQMDTVFKIIDGIKSYFYSAIDTKLKFSFSLTYPKLNSFNTLDFFKKLEMVYPLAIKSVQTDNGLEFQGIFESYLKKNNIPHYFIYPRCPRINGVIERYQRTLQEDFIDPNQYLIHQPKVFYDKLVEYLLFYNLERPHHSLGQKSPMEYLVSNGYLSQMSVTYTLN